MDEIKPGMIINKSLNMEPSSGCGCVRGMETMWLVLWFAFIQGYITGYTSGSLHPAMDCHECCQMIETSRMWRATSGNASGVTSFMIETQQAHNISSSCIIFQGVARCLRCDTLLSHCQNAGHFFNVQQEINKKWLAGFSDPREVARKRKTIIIQGPNSCHEENAGRGNA